MGRVKKDSIYHRHWLQGKWYQPSGAWSSSVCPVTAVIHHLPQLSLCLMSPFLLTKCTSSASLWPFCITSSNCLSLLQMTYTARGSLSPSPDSWGLSFQPHGWRVVSLPFMHLIGQQALTEHQLCWALGYVPGIQRRSKHSPGSPRVHGWWSDSKWCGRGSTGHCGDRNETQNQPQKSSRSRASFLRLPCPRRDGGGGRLENFF